MSTEITMRDIFYTELGDEEPTREYHRVGAWIDKYENGEALFVRTKGRGANSKYTLMAFRNLDTRHNVKNMISSEAVLALRHRKHINVLSDFFGMTRKQFIDAFNNDEIYKESGFFNFDGGIKL